MNRAIFIDRDGVLNKGDDHMYREEDLIFFSDVVETLIRLSQTDYKLFIVTNQAGIGQGIYSEEEFLQFQKIFVDKLKELSSQQIRIDKTYYCPHDPVAGEGEYKIECDCRKPNSGMLLSAAEEFDIDLGKSYMIGDRYTDIMAGERVGCKTILLRTGADNIAENENGVIPDYMFNSFSEILSVIDK